MDRFRIDFSMARGHEMIVDHEVGIERGRLDQVELQMLQSSRPPQLLPLEWFDMDGIVTFRYALDGRKMLAHRLQLQPISMQQFYSLLLAVVEALDECRHYMLRPEGCLLSERYLFVGEQLTDIRLAYMPIKESARIGDADFGDLLSLVVSWSARISAMDGSGLQRILQLVNEKKFPCSELRLALLELIGDSSYGYDTRAGSHPASAAKVRNDAAGLTGASERFGLPEGAISQYDRDVRGVQKWESREISGDWMSDADAAERYGNVSMHMPGAPEPENHQPSINGSSWSSGQGYSYSDAYADADPHSSEAAGQSRGKWIKTAFILLATAIAWRFLYVASPSQSSLYICLGLSMMGLAGVLFTWLKRPKAAWMEEEHYSDAEEEFNPVSRLLSRKGGREYAKREGKTDVQPTAAETIRPDQMSVPLDQATHEPAEQEWKHQRAGVLLPQLSSAENAPPVYEASMRTASDFGSYRGLPVQTDQAEPVEVPSDELTVMLGSDTEEDGKTCGGLALYREWQGKELMLPWDGEPYRIGRAEEQVSYNETAAGVSRLHLEIATAGDEALHAKDLGSRNGSLLNGTPMIAYKEYPVAPGDVIQLAGTDGPKYIFRQVG